MNPGVARIDVGHVGDHALGRQRALIQPDAVQVDLDQPPVDPHLDLVPVRAAVGQQRLLDQRPAFELQRLSADIGADVGDTERRGAEMASQTRR